MLPTELGSVRDDQSGAGGADPPGDAVASRREDDGPEVGGLLGRYVVLGRLGRGGMGTVLKAYDEALDRAIAVKLLHADVAERHEERLTREAQALAKLSHPNVVHVYEVARTRDQWFIAMELVHGQTMRQWQETRPSWRECVEAYLQAGEGLAAAHAHGLVHRDFKPDNCIVDDDGRVKVLDFGLVREVNARRRVRPQEVPLGEHGSEDPDAEPSDGDGAGDALRVEPRARAGIGPTLDDPFADERDTGTDDDERVTGADAMRPSLTRTGAVLGTLAYMPLEQLEGLPVDARSDQFSFCVSLYEAVYGERPFPGDAAPRVMVALLEGKVRSAPRGTRVPARLRRALLRGLSQTPPDRWPSMEPLLAELRDLVAPRRRFGPATWVGGGLLAVAAGLWQLARAESPCRGGRERLAAVWDDARRQHVESALLATELPHAADTWRRVRGRLDDYADAWVERHREVCEATSVRQEQSAEVMDLRMGCLSRRRIELRETVRVLARADETTVHRAVGMVAGLRGLSRCDDVEALRVRLPPPDDATVAAEVDAQRELLLRVHSLMEAGAYDEGLAEAQRVVERAAVLGYAPLQAEAWYHRGRLLEVTGQYAEAEEDLRRAYLLAAEHGHDAVEADAVSVLTAVVGRRQARHEPGLQWGMTALALARGDRSEPRREASALMNIGAVLHQKGELTRALERYREGLAIEQEVLGPRHPAVAMLLNNMGAVLFAQEEYAQALEVHRRAREIWEESLGARHPYVGSSFNNIGEVLHQQGELEEALSHFRSAQAIWEESLGPRHPYVASALANMGQVSADRGRASDAADYHQRALAIRTEALGPEHPEVAESRAHLARVQRASSPAESSDESTIATDDAG